MRKFTFTVAIFFISLFLYCCRFWNEDPGKILTLENYTEDSLMVYLSNGWLQHSVTKYPDTLLPQGFSSFLDRLSYHKHGKSFMNLYSANLESRNNKDTISIFVLSEDTIKKYGYEFVAATNNILVRYDLSKNDIISLNYVIPFPPTQEMENMKMFPPYQIAKNLYNIDQ